jgi:mandelate racemase
VGTHLLCASPTADWLDYAEWFNPIIAQALSIVDACAVLDGQPGSGVEWNEEAVGRYLVG